jgi:hypothetical protein
MKKKNFWYTLSFMFVAIFTLGFLSCGSDNDAGGNGGVSIVGTWVNGSTTMTLGKNGSYNLTDTSVPGIIQKRQGTYSYNANNSLMTVNVVAVAGQNGAYQHTYIVQTLTSTTLVLLYTDGDVEGYYTRK